MAFNRHHVSLAIFKSISKILLLLVGLCESSLLSFPVVLGAPLVQKEWQQEVSYKIEAELDTTAKELRGLVRIFYQNNSPDTLRQIYLQVPSNAFHDEENTAIREMRRFNRGDTSVDFGQSEHHELTIESLQFLNIGELSGFPVQAFLFSDTILDLQLPALLAPRDTLSIGISFKQQFGQNRSRSKNVSIPRDFVHWFPRLAVYDENGWHHEPFHFMMEPFDVFSEFADFSVTLTVPGNYIVVASGEMLDGDPGWESVRVDTAWKVTRFAAWQDSTKRALREHGTRSGPRRVRLDGRNLQNFTWSASPTFLYSPLQGRFPLHIFFPDYSGLAQILEAKSRLHEVLQYFHNTFGAYPFAHLAIITSSERPMADPWLARLQELEYFDLAYELSSIYFPGVVGSNGVEESWLAKGIQVYMGKSMMENIHGARGYDLEKARGEMNWLERQYPLPSLDGLFRNITRFYLESGQNEQISKPIHRYKDPIGAMSNLYLKSELFFEMLKFVVGDSLFRDSFQELVSRHKFSHIGETQLKLIFEEKWGQDLDWFFDQWLQGTPKVDYKKGKVRQYQRDDQLWITEVEVQRKGDGIMPVDIQVEIAGKEVVKRWDGKDDSAIITFESLEKPKYVAVDPEDRILDSNPLNNRKTRLEFRPDWPLLKFIHMPADAILVLWRPLIGYNTHDSVRLGFRTSTSYRAFYHNLILEGEIGVGSGEADGKVAYSNPLSSRSLVNRFKLMARKNEGRFETEAAVQLKASRGILTTNSRSLEFGLNFSGLLNDVYTFRESANDTGKVRTDEWEDKDILLAHATGRVRFGVGWVTTEAKLELAQALPIGQAQFTKVGARLLLQSQAFGLAGKVRGNLATSFGPDPLPLQDQFRAEGATARERFHHDVLKSGNGFSSFDRRHVEGGGFLRGYAGQPLPSERFGTINFEVGPAKQFLIFKVFGFFDTGRIWSVEDGESFTRSDAGLAITAFGDGINLMGGNLSLFSDLSTKVYFPLWQSDPLPGEKQTRFRWYLTIGKAL